MASRARLTRATIVRGMWEQHQWLRNHYRIALWQSSIVSWPGYCMFSFLYRAWTVSHWHSFPMLSLFSLSFFLFSTQVLAFHFSFNPPSECDDIGLTWTGVLTSRVSSAIFNHIFRRGAAIQAAYHSCTKYLNAVDPTLTWIEGLRHSTRGPNPNPRIQQRKGITFNPTAI